MIKDEYIDRFKQLYVAAEILCKTLQFNSKVEATYVLLMAACVMSARAECDPKKTLESFEAFLKLCHDGRIPC